MVRTLHRMRGPLSTSRAMSDLQSSGKAAPNHHNNCNPQRATPVRAAAPTMTTANKSSAGVKASKNALMNSHSNISSALNGHFMKNLSEKASNTSLNGRTSSATKTTSKSPKTGRNQNSESNNSKSVKSILKGSKHTKRKKGVVFREEEQVIGYGGLDDVPESDDDDGELIKNVLRPQIGLFIMLLLLLPKLNWIVVIVLVRKLEATH